MITARSLYKLTGAAFVAGLVVASMAFGFVFDHLGNELRSKQMVVDYLLEQAPASPEEYIGEHTFEEICGQEL